MIRVSFELCIVAQTEEAYWLATISQSAYRDILARSGGNESEARQDIRDSGEKIFRIEKTEDIREALCNRFGYPLHVEQVVNAWPRKINPALELGE